MKPFPKHFSRKKRSIFKTSAVKHSVFQISNSKIQFLRGTRCNFSVSQQKESESDNDSIASVSNEDSDCYGEDVNQEEPVQVDKFGEDFNTLFHCDEDLKRKEVGHSCFCPLNQSDIPTHLKSIIEDCGLPLG